MRYLRFLFVLAFTTGLGSAEAATFGPPPIIDAAPGQPAETQPAALGSPCFGSTAVSDRQMMAFTLDMFSSGPFGYAPMGPPGAPNGMLGLLCRITSLPIGRN